MGYSCGVVRLSQHVLALDSNRGYKQIFGSFPQETFTHACFPHSFLGKVSVVCVYTLSFACCGLWFKSKAVEWYI